MGAKASQPCGPARAPYRKPPAWTPAATRVGASASAGFCSSKGVPSRAMHDTDLSTLQKLCKEADLGRNEKAHRHLKGALLSFSSEALLRAELLRLRRTDPLSAQYGMRLSRSLHCRRDLGTGESLFLVAFSFVLQENHPSTIRGLTTGELSRELQAWAEEHLAEPIMGSRCVVSPLPESSALAQVRLSASLYRLASGMILGRASSDPASVCLGTPPTALVWPLAFKVTQAYCDVLENELLLQGPQGPAAGLKHRLAERWQGLRLFGVASWSDACSLSRLAALRLAAQGLSAQAYRLEKDRVVLLRDGQEVFISEEFLEETPQDLAEALLRVKPAGLPCESSLSTA